MGTGEATSTGGASTGGTSTGGASTGAIPGAPFASCNGLASTCGPSSNESCCTSPLVPGGTFYRSYDGVNYTDKSYPATVSDFRLDRFEVTVGRFRKFVAEYSQTMIPAGAGKNPHDPDDPGWDTAWNASLPADTAALEAAVQCTSYPTWTTAVGSNENEPITCITWFESFAFCIWDGGRLPTEAEWNYAAAGGSEQREYPWSTSGPMMIDCSYANINASCGTPAPKNVGAESPKGDGKYDQADLAGNVWEWTLDWYGIPYATPCMDCADTTKGTGRILRGGSFYYEAVPLSYRFSNYPTFLGGGVRCARSP
jgi:formylglycine-generating enzyme required for sulfatase activity